MLPYMEVRFDSVDSMVDPGGYFVKMLRIQRILRPTESSPGRDGAVGWCFVWDLAKKACLETRVQS